MESQDGVEMIIKPINLEYSGKLAPLQEVRFYTNLSKHDVISFKAEDFHQKEEMIKSKIFKISHAELINFKNHEGGYLHCFVCCYQSKTSETGKRYLYRATNGYQIVPLARGLSQTFPITLKIPCFSETYSYKPTPSYRAQESNEYMHTSSEFVTLEISSITVFPKLKGEASRLVGWNKSTEMPPNGIDLEKVLNQSNQNKKLVNGGGWDKSSSLKLNNGMLQSEWSNDACNALWEAPLNKWTQGNKGYKLLDEVMGTFRLPVYYDGAHLMGPFYMFLRNCLDQKVHTQFSTAILELGFILYTGMDPLMFTLKKTSWSVEALKRFDYWLKNINRGKEHAFAIFHYALAIPSNFTHYQNDHQQDPEDGLYYTVEFPSIPSETSQTDCEDDSEQNMVVFHNLKNNPIYASRFTEARTENRLLKIADMKNGKTSSSSCNMDKSVERELLDALENGRKSDIVQKAEPLTILCGIKESKSNPNSKLNAHATTMLRFSSNSLNDISLPSEFRSRNPTLLADSVNPIFYLVNENVDISHVDNLKAAEERAATLQGALFPHLAHVPEAEEMKISEIGGNPESLYAHSLHVYRGWQANGPSEIPMDDENKTVGVVAGELINKRWESSQFELEDPKYDNLVLGQDYRRFPMISIGNETSQITLKVLEERWGGNQIGIPNRIPDQVLYLIGGEGNNKEFKRRLNDFFNASSNLNPAIRFMEVNINTMYPDEEIPHLEFESISIVQLFISV